MSEVAGLNERVQALLELAEHAYEGTPGAERIRTAAARFREPLRVAIAGKVKAGKSTLLNALVGEDLAPTDAGECTKVVTWYRDGTTYRATIHPRVGEPHQAPLSRESGVAVDLGGLEATEIDWIDIEWPSASLRTSTLIDTPGIASASRDISERTVSFLVDDAEPTEADAVLYLMRHLHANDVRFLESFRGNEVAGATPINAIGILSRADEIGVGRLDAMESASRIAARYRTDPKVKRLCQTVVPMAGLIAASGTTLREDEFRALRLVADAEEAEVERVLLTADRFAHGATSIDLVPEQREALLDRFGLFGVRLSVHLLRTGVAANATELSAALVSRSGLVTLREVLASQFQDRRDVLKARAALLAIEATIDAVPTPGAEGLETELERLRAGAHEFAELRLLNALFAGSTDLREADAAAAEQLLGVEGSTTNARLGLPPDASTDAARAQLASVLAHWQARAESPMSSRAAADAARVLVRTCEGLAATI